MELNTASLSVFTQLANVMFEMGRESAPAYARNSGLFKVETVPANTGNLRQYTEADVEEYASYKGESDQATRARVSQGFTKTLTSYRVAKDIGISYEMRTQNKYQEVMNRLTNLAPLAINRMDLDLSHRLGFGTATTYTDMDGRVVDIATGETTATALFDTTHDLNGSSTTFRNRLANNPRFSRGAIEAMERQAIENSYNHLGEKVVMTFDIIWSTDDPNTCNTIREFLKSTGAPEQNNPGVTNVYQGKYRHVVLPRIATTAVGAPDSSKRYYWGIASSRWSTAHLAIWEEIHMKEPSNLNAGEEFSTDDWNFGVRAGYGIAIVNGNWVHASTGDGTA